MRACVGRAFVRAFVCVRCFCVDRVVVCAHRDRSTRCHSSQHFGRYSQTIHHVCADMCILCACVRACVRLSDMPTRRYQLFKSIKYMHSGQVLACARGVRFDCVDLIAVYIWVCVCVWMLDARSCTAISNQAICCSTRIVWCVVVFCDCDANEYDGNDTCRCSHAHR